MGRSPGGAPNRFRDVEIDDAVENARAGRWPCFDAALRGRQYVLGTSRSQGSTTARRKYATNFQTVHGRGSSKMHESSAWLYGETEQMIKKEGPSG